MSTDPVIRSDEFDRRLSTSTIVRSLQDIGRTNSRLIRWLIVSVILDLSLSLAVLFLAWMSTDTANQARQASARAAAAATTTRINCLSSNQVRVQSQQLWDYVLSFPPTPGETASQRRHRLAETAKFKAHIKKVFAPRDCNSPALAKSGAAPFTVPSPTSTAPAVSPSSAAIAGTSPPARGGVGTPRSQTRPGPTPTPSARSPTPSPSPTGSHSPSPSPSPSKCVTTGVAQVCVGAPSFAEAFERWFYTLWQEVGYGDTGRAG